MARFILPIYRIIGLFSVLLLVACGGGGETPPKPGSVSVTMTMAALPDSITYNKSTTLDRGIEYEWGVTFDVDGNDQFNIGDAVLRLVHFKNNEEPEITAGLDTLAANLWVYTADDQLISDGTADVTISGNSITLKIDRAADASLDSIDSDTPVSVQTTMRIGNGSETALIHDHLPERVADTEGKPVRQYAKTTDGMLTDNPADDAIEVANYPRIDIVNISLTFE